MASYTAQSRGIWPAYEAIMTTAWATDIVLLPVPVEMLSLLLLLLSVLLLWAPCCCPTAAPHCTQKFA